MRLTNIVLIFLFLISCKQETLLDVDVYRFEKELFDVDSLNIDNKLLTWDSDIHDFTIFYYKELLGVTEYKDIRSLILEGNYHPELAPQNRTIELSIQKEFPTLKEIELEIERVFSNAINILPDIVVPKKIVTVNGENIGGGMMFKRDTVVLCLDRYLGFDHYVNNSMYNGVPEYMMRGWEKEFIVRDIFENWCNIQYDIYEKATFIDHLIYKGKIMYIMSECLEGYEVQNILRFSEEDMIWSRANEHNIWNEIIITQLLYDSDWQRFVSFFDPSPYTSGMPNDSPGRLGYFIGYQIVSSYMNQRHISPIELMQDIDAQDILLQSKYNGYKKDGIPLELPYRWIYLFLTIFVLYLIYKRYFIK